MDIHYWGLSIGHSVALTFVIYFGCTLSIICLLLWLFSFQCFGTSGGDRIFMHKNLCFSLLITEAVFLGDIWQIKHSLCCNITAGMLHYFFLAAFAWMLLGFEPLFLLFGYGFSLAVVAASVWFDRFSYGTKRHCWLRSDNYFILAFAGLVVIVVLCNTVFLMLMLFTVYSHSYIGYTPCKQDRESLKNFRS
ncbi:unnamed protein product [Gongylonema pulchrum]|uniref:G_PROTEIN_RECEP_F2_4 domain-containing protein n=1 Tax=Gongylonema pulchrum TaxID=637853 RepID=A0A183CVQ1_9BILA|nr:unnamed protein product [Gongylonema pulchrum]